MKTQSKILILLLMAGFSITAYAKSFTRPNLPEPKEDKEYTAFCKALGKIIDAASNGLNTVLGDQITSEDEFKTWKSKLNLPGITKAYIKDEMVVSKYYYARYERQTEDSVRALYKKYYAYLEKCMVPKGFHIQKTPNDRGFDDIEDIVYRMSDDSPIPIEKRPFLQMSVTYDNVHLVYFLSITVYENFL
jgi:hypothetical protein